MMEGGMCPCPHHKIVPVCLLLIGLVFFLEAVGSVSMGFTNVCWPILLMIIALTKLMRCKCDMGMMKDGMKKM